MNTPTDYAKLGDEIEALAKALSKGDLCEIYIFDGEQEFLLFCKMNAPTIIAALRELEAVKAENAKLRDYEALAKAAARWSHPERRQPHCAVTAEEMLSAIWRHPSRAALGGAG